MGTPGLNAARSWASVACARRREGLDASRAAAYRLGSGATDAVRQEGRCASRTRSSARATRSTSSSSPPGSAIRGTSGICRPAHYLGRLASFSRLISFDKYGIGHRSDQWSMELPPLEDWMDDVSTVMDAVGLERAAIAGAGEASPGGALRRHVSSVRPLVLMNATARVSAAPGYEIGHRRKCERACVSMVEQTWGRGDPIRDQSDPRRRYRCGRPGDASFACSQARQRLRPSCACFSSSTYGTSFHRSGCPRSSSTAGTTRSSPSTRDGMSRSTSKARFRRRAGR